MLNFFKLNPQEQSFLNLVEEALNKKSYTIKDNYYFYDDGKHHLFKVEVHLSNGVDVMIASLYAGKPMFSKIRGEEKYGDLPHELYSSKAYKTIVRHLENLLTQAEQAAKDAIEAKRNQVLEAMTLPTAKDEVKAKMKQITG